MSDQEGADDAVVRARCRRVVWALAVALLAGTALHIVGDQPIVVFDELNYASQDRTLHDRFAASFSNAPLSAPWWDGLHQAVLQATESNRPAFYWPSALLSAALSFDWSIDLATLLNTLIYLLILLISTVRLMGKLAPESPQAAVGAMCCLVLCSVLWDSSVVLMGDMPVAAIVAATINSWIGYLLTRRWSSLLWFAGFLAWGLTTKPIYMFFALPMAIHVVFAIVRSAIRMGGGRGIQHAVIRGLLAFGLPVLVLVLSFESLWAFTSELHLVNERLVYFLRNGSLGANLAWPLTFLSQSFPLYVLPLLVASWLLALRHREGRRLAAAAALLMAYVSLFINQRHARQFEGFIPILAALSGIGLASLGGAVGRWSGRLFVGVAALMVVTVVAQQTSLQSTLFRCSVVSAREGEGALPTFELVAAEQPLTRRGDEYRHYKVRHLVALSGMWDDPSITLFVPFSTPRLNWTSYQSQLLIDGDVDARRRRFFSNSFRYGGFGEPGGLSPRLFDATYILVKSGKITMLRPEVEFYHILISAELSTPGSPLAVGLRPVGHLDLPAGEKLYSFRRTRAPSPTEWIAIADLLSERDHDNPWNVRYALEVLRRAADLPDHREAVQRAAAWVRHFEDEDGQPGLLSARYPWAAGFPELTELYREAWEAARALP